MNKHQQVRFGCQVALLLWLAYLSGVSAQSNPAAFDETGKPGTVYPPEDKQPPLRTPLPQALLVVMLGGSAMCGYFIGLNFDVIYSRICQIGRYISSHIHLPEQVKPYLPETLGGQPAASPTLK